MAALQALTLTFVDPRVEKAYCARNFRNAYGLHVTYTLSLIFMFIVGAMDETFRVASWTLGPGFVAALAIRVALHHQKDEEWAQSIGVKVMCVVDAIIWFASAWIFRGFVGRINAPVIIYGMYCIAMVLYPIILMFRTFTHVQRSIMVLIAVAATTASPVWIEGLTQIEFVSTNLSALLTGAVFAYFMERLERENELISSSNLRAALATAMADSRLNHLMKNKIVVIDHRLDLAREHLAPALAKSSEQLALCDHVAVDHLLQEAQTSMQACVEWIHRREIFLQLAHGRYRSAQQITSVRDVLRSCTGSGVQLQLECPPTLWIDVFAMTLVLEEAVSNARKYGDDRVPIVVRAHIEVASTQVGGGDKAGGEVAARGAATLVVEVDSVDPVGATRLTDLEATRAFEHGVKGTRTSAFTSSTPYSDGLGLPSARDAAQAAGGRVQLLCREDATSGRVHTILLLRVPVQYDQNSPQTVCEPRLGGEGALASWSVRNAKRSEAASPRPSGGHTDAAASSDLKRSGGVAASTPPDVAVKPVCVIFDDDCMVQDVMTTLIEGQDVYEVVALGETLDEQWRAEDAIMGVRDPHDVTIELQAPHTPAAVVVIDQNITLPPPWPAHLKGQRADGKPIVPADGLDLATRLRARGYAGKIIMHSGAPLHELEELAQHPAVDQAIEKGNAARFRAQFEEVMAVAPRNMQQA